MAGKGGQETRPRCLNPGFGARGAQRVARRFAGPPPEKRLLKEVSEFEGGACASLCVVQFLPNSCDAENNTRDASADCRLNLVSGRFIEAIKTEGRLRGLQTPCSSHGGCILYKHILMVWVCQEENDGQRHIGVYQGYQLHRWVQSVLRPAREGAASSRGRQGHHYTFDTALLISGDSDHVPTIETVRQTFGKNVIVAFPPKRESADLQAVATATFRIGKAKFESSLLPRPVILPNGRVIECPQSGFWLPLRTMI